MIMAKILTVVLGAALTVLMFGCKSEHGETRTDTDDDGHTDHWERKCGAYRLYELDTTSDGKPDAFHVERDGQLLVRERDTNGEGVSEEWHYLENTGGPLPVITSLDRDFDGKVDERWLISYGDAGVEITNMDLDCNGITDQRFFARNDEEKAKVEVLFEGEWVLPVIKEGKRGILRDGQWREVQFNKDPGRWEIVSIE